MLRTSTLLSRGAVSTLPRSLSACLLSTSFSDSQWKSPSRSRGAKPTRWGLQEAVKEVAEEAAEMAAGDVPQLAGDGVYGIHSVLQALESGHRDAHALYVREERAPMDGQRPKKKNPADVRALERIRELAQSKDVEIHSTSKWMLNHITGDKPHQGVVLDAAPIQLKEFVPAEPSAIACDFVLDEIHDPQNFGAILRSAHFLGCSAVVVSDRNTAPLSPAVSRASVGALEVMVANDKLMKARNLHEMLAISGDLGWRVVGASSGPNSITSTKLSADGQPTILVMGNEHRGLRKGIRQCCQDIVIIPGQATDEDTRVDSLNVSVASAILLYELLHH
ncbi:50S ribosomal protein L30e-like [Phytophthora cactorum]|nr:50S ribosomal protein L30e-like [Phytophthora cactorum]